MNRAVLFLLSPSVVAVALAITSGCTTEAYCFRDCEGDENPIDQDGGSDTGLIDDLDGGDDGSIELLDGSSSRSDAEDCLWEGPEEACDGRDNNCNGEVDEGFDFTSARYCGTCDNNCQAADWVVTVRCDPPDVLDGTVPGTCVIEGCDSRQYDLDGDPTNGCEYFCNTDGEATVDDAVTGCGRDDDCDGIADEDLNLCEDVEHCGSCMRSCLITGVHATFECVSTAADGEECDTDNTACQITGCDDGYVDANGDPLDGCEYQCTPDGPEVCDGVDNDCDRLVDNADPDLESDDAEVGEPAIGDPCTGGDQGLCAEREGVRKCISNQLKCCDVASNDEESTNENFPTTGLRNAICDSEDGVQVLSPGELPETCNGEDDDCDGVVDGTAAGASGTSCTDDSECEPGEACLGPSGNRTCVLPSADIGAWCGSDFGNCSHGTTACVDGQLQCAASITGTEDDCNGQDDNCDSVIDGSVSNGAETDCTDDSDACTSGEVCLPVGVDPAGQDDSRRVCVPTCTGDADCSGGRVCLPSTISTEDVCVIPPQDASGDCDVPPAVDPAEGVSACTAGILQCEGGVVLCAGSHWPAPGPDTCGVDANCDGEVDFEHDPSDIRNCGSCGNDCTAGRSPFAVWDCLDSGSGYECVRTGCVDGFIECGGTNPDDCETACTVNGTGEELCNTLDDDCNCYADNAEPVAEDRPVVPTSAEVCGVAAAATDPGCLGRAAGGTVDITCVDGAWQCAFTSGVHCQGTPPSYCAVADDCDGYDNDCNGTPDQDYLTGNAVGEPCNSDDHLPPPGHGRCRQSGHFACVGPEGPIQCDVRDQPDLDQALDVELCNGEDDDCDGVVDEHAGQSGSGNDIYVKPAVVALGSSGPWVFAYEASRPNATATSAGSGNGFFDAAPPGKTLDQTIACSAAGAVPWTNVSPWEIEQSCAAIGGHICTLEDWQTACWVNAGSPDNSCLYGYSPATTAANTGCQDVAPADYSAGPFCNLGGFDADGDPATGDQDELLPTASGDLNACLADWSTYFGNSLGLYDVTGNARELTRCQKDRAVCGGPSNSADICAQDCCSGTSSAVNGPTGATRLCGDLSNSRRLHGQPCDNQYQCCNNDEFCDDWGTCSGGVICEGPDGTCRTRGVSGCTQDSDCCDGDPCVGGTCGGPDTLPHAAYPLMGGGYVTVEEEGATCDFEFYKVNPGYKLFDAGFRCCFDSNPSPP